MQETNFSNTELTVIEKERTDLKSGINENQNTDSTTIIGAFNNEDEDSVVITASTNGSEVFKDEPHQLIQFLSNNKDKLFSNEMGIYLNNEVYYKGEKLLFPYLKLGVSTHSDSQRQLYDQVRSFNALVRRFEIDQYFKLLKIGDDKVVILSKLLFSRSEMNGLIEFFNIESEVFIENEDKNLKPFFYSFNDSDYCLSKDITEDHEWVNCDFSTFEAYTEHENSNDPYNKIDLIIFLLEFKRFEELPQNSSFIKRIKEYSDCVRNISLSYFNINNQKNLSFEEICDSLKEKFRFTVKGRSTKFLSFNICPVCKKASNAHAYPNRYVLKCYNKKCDAYIYKGGLPLPEWSELEENIIKNKINPFSEDNYEMSTIESIAETIKDVIRSPDSVLLNVTMGVGKTHAAILEALKLGLSKTVIFSFLNNDLKDEAFKKAQENNSDGCNIKNLNAKNRICKNKELKEAIKYGLSPSHIVCDDCRLKKEEKCQYYTERKGLNKPGVYFVTHAMMQYHKIENPDLIIIDENVIDGFTEEIECNYNDLISLYKLIDSEQRDLIKEIIAIGDSALEEFKK